MRWNDVIEGRRDFTLTTYTGRIINVLDPKPEDICLGDIARGLSMQCRYAGQIQAFYTVAEHSVLCARASQTRGDHDHVTKAVLLHDAAEAYVGDLIGPVKGALRSLGSRHFDYLEALFARAIAIRFDLEAPDSVLPSIEEPLTLDRPVFSTPVVKMFDKAACAREQLSLRKMPPGWKVSVEPLDTEPFCWRPSRAEREFYDFAERLGLASADAETRRPEAE